MLGDRLKLLRTQNNLTLKELGEKIGVSLAAIGYYERNEREPSLSILCKIADYFKVTTDYLLDISEHKTRDEDILYQHIISMVESLEKVQIVEAEFDNIDILNEAFKTVIEIYLAHYAEPTLEPLTHEYSELEVYIHYENEFRKKISKIEHILKPLLLLVVQDSMETFKFIYKNDDYAKAQAEYADAQFAKLAQKEGAENDRES